ncbi:MAG TPA: hypothetical protein VFT59_03590, partial [Candidatus Saccharimonadales bacterium]|nr:hypothetical protein [Candidatus Saccharimonadales bacterium]
IPTVVILLSAFISWSTMASLAVLLLLISTALYGFYLYHIWKRDWWLGALLWPVIVFQELVVLVMSIWGYARKSITWKGRTVAVDSARKTA